MRAARPALRRNNVHGTRMHDVGIVFPALLPPTTAWTNSMLLGDEPRSMPQLLTAIAVTTLCWLGALLTGLALAFA